MSDPFRSEAWPSNRFLNGVVVLFLFSRWICVIEFQVAFSPMISRESEVGCYDFAVANMEEAVEFE